MDSELIGGLTEYRCQKCGCCLYENRRGNIWCGGCGDRPASFDGCVSVKIPEDHPHHKTNRLTKGYAL